MYLQCDIFHFVVMYLMPLSKGLFRVSYQCCLNKQNFPHFNEIRIFKIKLFDYLKKKFLKIPDVFTRHYKMSMSRKIHSSRGKDRGVQGGFELSALKNFKLKKRF